MRPVDPQTQRADLLMPVSDHQAVELIGIEALRSINKALEKVADKLDGQGQTLHSMDTRLVRMEANDELIRALVLKVDALERDKDRRDGAMSGFEWIAKSPLIGWCIAGGVALWAIVNGQG